MAMCKLMVAFQVCKPVTSAQAKSKSKFGCKSVWAIQGDLMQSIAGSICMSMHHQQNKQHIECVCGRQSLKSLALTMKTVSSH